SSRYQGVKRIVVVISSIFNGPRHKAIKRVLGSYLKDHTRVPFFIYFHSTKADMNCQMADYCGWAIGIKWERKDSRSYDLISQHIKSEFPIFDRGIDKYY